MCGDLRELHPNDQDSRPYSKGGSWSDSDSNAPFYAEYLRDPELHLPEGTYRIFARLFWMNESCGGEPVHVDSSIVIRVVADDDLRLPSPMPSPSPADAIACGAAAVSIVNAGDLVVSCRPLSADESDELFAEPIPDGVRVVTTAEDPTHVRIGITMSHCTHDVWLNLMGNNADRAFFQVSPSAGCMLMSLKLVGIELILRRPVDVLAGRVVPV